MLAISQAAWDSPTAPMRDRAGNSVLQNNQLLPGEHKAHLGGFEKPDSFPQSPSSTRLTGNCCITDLPGTSITGLLPNSVWDHGRGGSSRDENHAALEE